MSETDVWLNIIRTATEIEISKIESAKSVDEVNLHHFATERLLSLIVDLSAYNKLWRYADEAGELCTELDKKMWEAVDMHRDLYIAEINGQYEQKEKNK
nr:MAG TPA: hypothetical protein [Caudoviricetes sp.]